MENLNNIFNKGSLNRNSEIEKDVYDTLLKLFPDMVILLDFKGNIIDLSDNFVQMYGAGTKQEYVGKNFFNCVAEKDRESAIESFKNVLKEGYIKMVEYSFSTKNGKNFIGELSLSVVKDELDNTLCLLGIIRDITNQKNIENELRENKEMFQIVMDNIPQLISWKDLNSVYIGCNKAFARFAGLDDPTKISGKTDYDLPWRITEAESFFEIDQLVMDTDKAEYHIIEPLLQASGKNAWLDTNKIPLHDSKDNVVGLLCTYEDISERVNAEKALTDSERRYREAFSHVEFYKDIFAHDISNILQNILSCLELSQMHLANIQKDTDLAEIFDIIKTEIIRGATLVSNVRKLSILDEAEPLPGSIEVFHLLNRARKKLEESSFKKKIKIKIESNYEKYYVKASFLIKDAFENLLYNAIKHNSKSEVNILIRASEYTKNLKRFLKLEFIDNGNGIPDEQKEKLFQDANPIKNYSRIGLGLSLVKKIIDSIDGQIWVEDKVKGDYFKGCNFVMLLPKAIIH